MDNITMDSEFFFGNKPLLFKDLTDEQQMKRLNHAVTICEKMSKDLEKALKEAKNYKVLTVDDIKKFKFGVVLETFNNKIYENLDEVKDAGDIADYLTVFTTGIDIVDLPSVKKNKEDNDVVSDILADLNTVLDSVVTKNKFPFYIDSDKERLTTVGLDWKEIPLKNEKDKKEDKEDMDTEFFGFGTKYTSGIKYTKVKEYFKDIPAEHIYLDSPYYSLPKTITKELIDKCKPVIKHLENSIKEGKKKVEARIVKTDSFLMDNKKYKEHMEAISGIMDMNTKKISEAEPKDLSKQFMKLHNKYYDLVKDIYGLIRDNVEEVKKDKEDIQIHPSDIDLELFGFSKKYISELTYANFDEYLKNTGELIAVLHTLGDHPTPNDKELDLLNDIVRTMRKNYKDGIKKVPARKVKPNSYIIDDDKYEKHIKVLERIYKKNIEKFDKKLYNDNAKKAKSIFKNYYDLTFKILETLRKGINVIKVDKEEVVFKHTEKELSCALLPTMDKEDYILDLESISDTLDLEMFTAIKGILNTAMKKYNVVCRNISDLFSSRGNMPAIYKYDRGAYLDNLDTLVPVPSGYHDTVLTNLAIIGENTYHLASLDEALDETIMLLSKLVNSKNYRESSGINPKLIKTLRDHNNNLKKEVSKLIGKDPIDKRTLESLVPKFVDFEEMEKHTKIINKSYKTKDIKDLTYKIKEIDELIILIIENQNEFSRDVIKELTAIIDQLLAYSTNVGVLIFHKNSTMSVMNDIEKLQ